MLISPDANELAMSIITRMCKKEAASKIELRCEDGLKADISSCDIVYVSNLLANEAFNKKFGEVCDRQLRPGSILFAIKEVPLSRGTKIDELTGDTDCSWGIDNKIRTAPRQLLML